MNYFLSEKRKSCNLHPPRAAVGKLEGILLKLALMGRPPLNPRVPDGYFLSLGLDAGGNSMVRVIPAPSFT